VERAIHDCAIAGVVLGEAHGFASEKQARDESDAADDRLRQAIRRALREAQGTATTATTKE
jgi:hypothetical protein